MAKERKSNIELLRVIVMFMILLLHANITTFGWPEGDTLTVVSRLSMESVTIIAVMPFDSDWVKLAVGIPLGMVIYLAVAKIFRMPELQEALDILHRR